MARRKRLLIYECTPKKDDLNEGKALIEFLKMTNADVLKIAEVTNKSDFLADLADGTHLKGCQFVHIAAHGSDDHELALPRGYISPDEFPESCFKGKVVTFSACGLSVKDFMDRFIEVTEAKGAVACMYDAEFADTAVFYLCYYYLVLHHNLTTEGAFNRVEEMLCYKPSRGRVKGGWFYWAPD